MLLSYLDIAFDTSIIYILEFRMSFHQGIQNIKRECFVIIYFILI